MNIDAIAEILAQAGRDIILPAFRHVDAADIKADGSVVTAVDIACQDFVQRHLAALHPDIPLLGEEMSAAEQRCILRRGRFWCLDPLDGTSNFAARLPLFAIALVLIEAGRPQLAWIHDPVRGETFFADKDRARLNGRPIEAASQPDMRAAIGFIDFKRLPAETAAYLATHRFYRSQRNLGSCALEWAWLAAGRGQFIVHGGQKIWDYAPGLAIAAAAGCTATDFAGASLLPIDGGQRAIAAAAGADLHAHLLQLLAAARADTP